jgi:hypothetical protein
MWLAGSKSIRLGGKCCGQAKDPLDTFLVPTLLTFIPLHFYGVVRLKARSNTLGWIEVESVCAFGWSDGASYGSVAWCVQKYMTGC